MKNNEEEPKEYFERNRLHVALVLIVALLIDWLSYRVLADLNPLGIFIAIPGIVLTLQALWLIVNPYAIVYDNRFEIKQYFIYNKEFFYLDAKAVELKTTNSLLLTYNDYENDKLPLFGMRTSHKEEFKNRLHEKIQESLKGRDF